MRILLLFLFIYKLLAGTIKPGKIPILNTIANKIQLADYTFQFIPQTSVAQGGQVQVTFPSQYTPGLGIDPITSSTCSVRCSIHLNVVLFYFDNQEMLTGVQSNMTIYQVQNPTTMGGTGNFYLRTKKGVNIFDENLIFGAIGVADEITDLVATSVAPDQVAGTPRAGEPSRYNFAFKTTLHLPQSSYVELSLPDSGFIVSDFPSCSLFAISGQLVAGQIQCQKVRDNVIQVRGFDQDIPSGTDVGIGVSMTNPKTSLITGKFQIALFRNQTKVVYSWKRQINELQITPGLISGITFEPLIQNCQITKGKYVDYRLTFLPKNQLSQTSVITLVIPTAMSYLTTPDQYFYIQYGLDDLSATSTVNVVLSSNLIVISNYKPMTTPGLISILMRLTMPAVNKGITSAVEITTFSDPSLTQIIDQDQLSATTEVLDVNSGNLNTVSTTITSGPVIAGGAAFDMRISYTPTVLIKIGSIFKLTVPSSFQIGSILPANCGNGGGVSTSSASCSRQDNVLTSISTIQNNNAVSANVFYIGIIQPPINEGQFMFDLQIWDPTNQVLYDSYSFFLTVTPQPLVTFSAQNYGNELSTVGFAQYSILQISFTTILDIPKGYYIQQPTELQGEIELQISGTYMTDLGTGKVTGDTLPCIPITGILPIDGGRIVCTLTVGVSPIITITKFKALASATPVTIQIAKIRNPTSSPGTGVLKLRKKENRITTILNIASPINIAYVPYGPIVLGTTSDSFVFTPSTYFISTIFNLKFAPFFANDVPASSIIIFQLPGFDTGFLPLENTVTCFLHQHHTGGISEPVMCRVFPGIDWVVVELLPTQTITCCTVGPPKPQIEIRNLVWPRYEHTVAVLIWRQLDISLKEVEQKQLADLGNPGTFRKPTPSPFIKSQIFAPFKDQGIPGARYQFRFTTNNLILNGGSVRLTFPPEFSLMNSFPSPTFLAPQFESQDSQHPLTFSTTSNTLQISNIKEFPKEAPFSIIVQGIKNPLNPPDDNCNGWKIQSLYNNLIINIMNNFDSFTFGKAFQAGQVIFLSIEAFPLNAKQYAQYFITFTPSRQFRPLTEIYITFPSAFFPVLPDLPNCQLKGGLLTFKSCTTKGSSIVIVTDTGYSSGQVVFSITDVINPVAGPTDGFVIKIRFDGTYIDDTDLTSLVGRYLTIMPEPLPIAIKSIDFSPRNQAETATYTFIFVPSSIIYDTYMIYIDMPPVYDDLIGNQIVCEAKGGIISDIDCLVDQKRLRISGLTTYVPSDDDPINIQVTGIVNPNRVSKLPKGYFKIGIIQYYTSHYIDYNPLIPELTMLAAPGWAQITNVQVLTKNIRVPTTYTFNFTTTIPIPKKDALGEILMEFPDQFDIRNKITRCTTAQLQFYEDGEEQCVIKNNRAFIPPSVDNFSGILVLNVQSIENPVEIGQSKNIVIKTLDSFNQKIIEKSYFNLDPLNFYFVIEGPLISVNNQQTIIVERGTQSRDISIGFKYPCALNMTFFPILPDGVQMIPKTPQIYLGWVETLFRISVPENFIAGVYYIYWDIDGNQNTWLNDKPLYTPLKQSAFQVTSIQNIRVDVGILQEVPRGGSSLETFITTELAPSLSLEIVLTFEADYPGISLSSQNLLLTAGSNSISFILYCDPASKIQRGTIFLTLDGLNQNVYTLAKKQLDFVIIAPDVEAPFITDLNYNQLGLTHVKLALGCSEISTIYWMLALGGTDEPEREQVSEQINPKFNTTLTRYGQTTIGKSNRAEVLIKGLTAQTSYVVYAFALDRGNFWSDRKSFLFDTQDRYYAAEFTLQFKQAFLNEAERNNIRKAVAFILSLYHIDEYDNGFQQVKQQKYYFLDRRRRQLSGNENSSLIGYPSSKYSNTTLMLKDAIKNKTRQNLAEALSASLDMQIIMNPQSNVFLKPLDLINYLNMSLKLDLKKMLPNLDSDWNFEGKEFVQYVPTFVEPPNIINVTLNSIQFNVKFDNYAWVFGISSKATEDKQKPMPVQVYYGYNSSNAQVPNQSLECSEKFTYYNLTIMNLIEDTEYNIYLIAGSVHPGWPDIPLDQNEIVFKAGKTLFTPKQLHLNINKSILMLNDFLLFLMLIVITTSILVFN